MTSLWEAPSSFRNPKPGTASRCHSPAQSCQGCCWELMDPTPHPRLERCPVIRALCWPQGPCPPTTASPAQRMSLAALCKRPVFLGCPALDSRGVSQPEEAFAAKAFGPTSSTRWPGQPWAPSPAPINCVKMCKAEEPLGGSVERTGQQHPWPQSFHPEFTDCPVNHERREGRGEETLTANWGGGAGQGPVWVLTLFPDGGTKRPVPFQTEERAG